MTDFRKVVAVTGPTATGKTALAVHLAEKFGGEVVSIDSRQVYRGMDLGTGKDLEEYGSVPYHLMDIVNPDDEYNLSCFLHDAFEAIAGIGNRGRLPVLCGGSAMYLDALLKGYRLPGAALPRNLDEPRVRQERSQASSFEPPFALDALTIGVYFPRETVRSRIEKRLDSRLAQGMIEEVANLHAAGTGYERLDFFGLEYREVARYLQGKCSYDEMRSELLNKIRQFAKRQDIFFRKMEREGTVIHWLKEGNRREAEALTEKFLDGEALPEPEIKISSIFYGRGVTQTEKTAKNGKY